MTTAPAKNKFSSMPSAEPGVGECNICFEIVPCVKVLLCNHQLCLNCANKLVQAASTNQILCPECRQPTDVSRGVTFLKTRYFGKVRCDLCLEQKEAEDTWWCPECLQAICSKCTIKEHSKKRHAITEWNTMEPVRFSVDYLNEVGLSRQASTVSLENKQAMHHFMQETEKHLAERVTSAPELDSIKENLMVRYGSQFWADLQNGAPPTYRRSTSSNMSTDSDGPPRVVAKVLQLAGADVMEAVIPRVSEQRFQVYFSLTPEELADYIRTKMEFIPGETSETHCFGNNSAMQTVTEEGCNAPNVSITELKFNRNMKNKQLPVLQIDYSPATNVFAMRTQSDVQLYNLQDSGHCYQLPMVKASFNVHSICFGRSNNLYIVYQSSVKKYQWSLECLQINTLPPTPSFSSEFDVDPEDKVEQLVLAVPSVANVNHMYELRILANNLAEIWRVEIHQKPKKDVTKLKETLMYQKSGARFTRLDTLESGKEKFLIVWDELSNCLYRLAMIKDNRCELSTKILHSSHVIPYSLDTRGHLWLYDSFSSRLCVTANKVNNRHPVTMQQVAKYTDHEFGGLWVDSDVKVVCGFRVTSDAILVSQFSLPVTIGK